MQNTFSVTVTSAEPVLVYNPANSESYEIINGTGGNAVYLGGPTVTAETGRLLGGGVSVTFSSEEGEAVYAIAESTTSTLTVTPLGGPGTIVFSDFSSGPPGPTGPVSTVPGPTGPTGAASTVPGPTGPTGPASTVPGPTGPVSTVPGPTGPTGAASTVPGPTGPTGPASTVPGPTGPIGPEALTYSGQGQPFGLLGVYGNEYIDTASGLSYTKSNVNSEADPTSLVTTTITGVAWLTTNTGNGGNSGTHYYFYANDHGGSEATSSIGRVSIDPVSLAVSGQNDAWLTLSGSKKISGLGSGTNPSSANVIYISWTDGETIGIARVNSDDPTTLDETFVTLTSGIAGRVIQRASNLYWSESTHIGTCVNDATGLNETFIAATGTIKEGIDSDGTVLFYLDSDPTNTYFSIWSANIADGSNATNIQELGPELPGKLTYDGTNLWVSQNDSLIKVSYVAADNKGPVSDTWPLLVYYGVSDIGPGLEDHLTINETHELCCGPGSHTLYTVDIGTAISTWGTPTATNRPRVRTVPLDSSQTYALVTSDADSTLVVSPGSGSGFININPQATTPFTPGDEIKLIVTGVASGQNVNLNPQSPATINGSSGSVTIAGSLTASDGLSITGNNAFATITLINIAADTWVANTDLPLVPGFA